MIVKDDGWYVVVVASENLTGPCPHAAGMSLESIRVGLVESAARVQLAGLLGGDARADRQAWIAQAVAAGPAAA